MGHALLRAIKLVGKEAEFEPRSTRLQGMCSGPPCWVLRAGSQVSSSLLTKIILPPATGQLGKGLEASSWQFLGALALGGSYPSSRTTCPPPSLQSSVCVSSHLCENPSRCGSTCLGECEPPQPATPLSEPIPETHPCTHSHALSPSFPTLLCVRARTHTHACTHTLTCAHTRTHTHQLPVMGENTNLGSMLPLTSL